MANDQRNDRNKEHPNVKARILPHNTEAEQAVLGCAMIDEYAPVSILGDLKASDFYQKAHAGIFNAMQNIYSRNEPIDIITLVQECEATGIMDEVGGIDYLSSLTNTIPSADNFKHYVDIVKKNSMLRQLIEVSQKIMNTAYSSDPDDDALDLAEREIYALTEKQERSSLVSVTQAVDDAVSEMEEIFRDPTSVRGVPIPFKLLNSILNGFHPTDLVVVGARPGEGKTSLGMNFITHAAMSESRRTVTGKVNRYKCAVFSLEMSASQLATRMICSIAKVSMKKAKNGSLTHSDWEEINKARMKLSQCEIYIDDNAQTTPIEIISKCRRLKREKGLDFVLVDYLQLMSSGKRVESRQQEVSEISRMMKIAAKELKVPIILLSQLNREGGKERDKPPQLTHLRESGAIEQDADIILFIHRKYDPKDETIDLDTRNKVDIIVAKHRNGEQGTVTVRWCGERTSFVDIDTSQTTQVSEKFAPKSDGTFIMGDDDAMEEEDDSINLAPLADNLPSDDEFTEELNNIEDGDLEGIIG